MKLFLILLISLNCFANISGAELKKPNSTAFDFTYQSPQNKIQESLQDMIKIEIGKETFLTRRNNNIFSCGFDSFGNTYCPSNLAKADSYWDYENGYSVSGLGQVVDYTLKEKQYKCPSDNYLLVSKYYDSCSWCNDITYYEVRCSKNGTVTVLHEFRLKGNNAYNGGRLIQTYNQSNIGSNVGQTYLGNIGQGCNYLVYYSRTCDGINCNYNFSINSNCNGSTYSTSTVAPIPYIYSCPTGYCETTGSETSKGACKRTIEYTYYNYLCSDSTNNQNLGFAPANSGGNNCNKTDSNNTITNPELANSCNSSTPPTNNCKRLGFKCNSNERKPAFVDGEWKCSPFLCDGNMKCGYGTCDSPTTPSTNKYMDVAYNPLQYITNNKCNGPLCDYVLNKEVSYCESLQCPKGDDIIQDSGKCYKLECPAGTYLSGDKCIKVN